MSDAKYHHLIPRTYMSAWKHGKGDSIYVVKKDLSGNRDPHQEQRNCNNIFGVKGFHRIKPGMPICTSDDCSLLFAPLKGYSISVNGKAITSVEEMNENWYQFNQWEIKKPDGTQASNKRLKFEVENIVINDIETEWSEQYENGWPACFQQIEQLVGQAKTKTVPEFSKEYLMRFLISMDWRGFCSNKQFVEAYASVVAPLKDIMNCPIDEKDRYLPMLDTIEKEMKHCLLLKQYRNFLNGTGLMDLMSAKLMTCTTFNFMIASETHHFITSDNPAFEYVRDDGYKEVIMAISPTILLIQCRDSSGSNCYYRNECNDECVIKYNGIIAAHANEHIIMDDTEYNCLTATGQ